MKKRSLHSMVEIRSKSIIGLLMMLMLLLGSSQMHSVMGQTEAENQLFVDSLTASQISNFGDFTIENSLIRLPGVQVNRDGQLSFRGTGYNNFYMMVNGQRMAATGRNNRITNPGAISADVVKTIEWIKVLTPDMDADGFAGAVNLKTYQPTTTQTFISGSLGGGLNPKYQQETGATGRSWLRFTGPVSDNLSLAIDVNYQREQRAWESLGIGYGVVDLGSGPTDVIETLSPGFQSEGFNRFASNLQLNYTPSETSSYYFHGIVNINRQQRSDHSYNWIANGDWEDQTTTGTQADFGYDLNFEQRNTSLFTFQAGGQNNFDSFKLDYQAGLSQSIVDRTENLFPFLATGVEYTINDSNTKRPTASPLDAKPIPADLDLEEMNYIIDNYRDQEVSVRVNAEFPISVGSLKAGASAIFKEQDANELGAFSEYHYQFQGLLDLEGFEEGNLNSLSIFDGRYNLDRLADPQQALSFFEASIPNMRLDERAYYQDSEIYNYLGNENIYGTYGMTTLNFNPLTVIIGARVEHTTSSYEGRVVEYNRFNQFEDASDTSATTNQTYLFPNAQLKFEVNEQANVNAAYSRTISRPEFNLIAPFELLTPQDTSIFAGNPNLDPIISDNIDLMLNYEFAGGGLVSIGSFYKMMTGFIEPVSTQVQINQGEYTYFEPLFDDGVTQITGTNRTYQNSENTATVYGAEVTVQKQLSFLPGFLENFGAYANYTWSESDFENARGDQTDIPGQSPHVVNAALNYHNDRFFAQVSYHWSAELLSNLEENTQPAPSVSGGEVYFDRYQDGYQELSATAKFDLSDQVQLWTNIYNLLNVEQVEYAFSRSNYPTSIYQRNGIEFNVGVRVSL
ncbi:TonB-dependent receptor [Gracilimonas sp.]|uniref:TonB-dependent receptor n=1 Tax=Gracilimonas sp. TaxID=1974203 RepID=UPI0032EBCAE0